MSDYALPLKRLGVMAKEGKPQAMRLLGRVAASQGKDTEALEWFRKAAEGSAQLDFEDAGEALVCEGQILQRSNRRDAEAAFRKAALEFDNPSAYWHLSQLEDEGSSHREIYLLKAASSGIVEAAYELGSAALSKTKASGGNYLPPFHGMAREWFEIAATDGHGPSMLAIAQVCKASGEVDQGLKWLGKAKKLNGVREEALRIEEGWGTQQ
jgi:TPR repeat protein